MKEEINFYTLIEISNTTGLTLADLEKYISRGWISPLTDINTNEEKYDHEDLARIQLIKDLYQNLGLNEDAIPVVLHLLDQIHYLRNQLLTQSTNNS